MTEKIFRDICELKAHLDKLGYQVYATSGGFDPLHVGHLRCIQESSEISAKMASRWPSRPMAARHLWA